MKWRILGRVPASKKWELCSQGEGTVDMEIDWATLRGINRAPISLIIQERRWWGWRTTRSGQGTAPPPPLWLLFPGVGREIE